jgi:hypothetical protein
MLGNEGAESAKEAVACLFIAPLWLWRKSVNLVRAASSSMEISSLPDIRELVQMHHCLKCVVEIIYFLLEANRAGNYLRGLYDRLEYAFYRCLHPIHRNLLVAQ